LRLTASSAEGAFFFGAPTARQSLHHPPFFAIPPHSKDQLRRSLQRRLPI